MVFIFIVTYSSDLSYSSMIYLVLEIMLDGSQQGLWVFIIRVLDENATIESSMYASNCSCKLVLKHDEVFFIFIIC
jgi:hypothetical protein